SPSAGSAGRIDAARASRTVARFPRAIPTQAIPVHGPDTSRAASRGPPVTCLASLHVAPVFLLQQVGDEREEREEQDHPDAKALALERGRFTDVLQESCDVAGGLVELDLVLRARLRDLEVLDRRFAGGRVGLAVDRALQALHLPERVG